MSKIADYLQEHLVGEVMTSADARRYFSTDASIFSVLPAIVVYPRNENDVRKAARFTWQLAERDRKIPITARGLGSDLTGAALGAGVVIVFPAHQHRILELDTKSGDVTVEPGITYGKLQQTLLTHGRFLPPCPASAEYSTIGGAIANNAGGERSYKYGTTRDFVTRLRVVLANGEVIETGRISKRELNKKLGLSSMEGEIYRQLDALIEENREVIAKIPCNVVRNNAGYALAEVKRKDGSFDLTPLLVGSQGTLALVTEVTLSTELYAPGTTDIMATCKDAANAQEVLTALRALSDKPSSIEMVDGQTLGLVRAINPAFLKEDFDASNVVLFVECDNPVERSQKRLVKKIRKILDKHDVPYRVESEQAGREELRRVRAATTTILTHSDGQAKPLPIIDDAAVSPDKLADFMAAARDLFAQHDLEVALWGHAGDGVVHAQPMFNIAELGDRQKIFKLVDQYYQLVISMGGSTTGEYGDGRLRGALLPTLYGAEIYELFTKTKHIFDPHGTFNPGVKIGATLEDAKHLLRSDYDLGHIYSHMPRS